LYPQTQKKYVPALLSLIVYEKFTTAFYKNIFSGCTWWCACGIDAYDFFLHSRIQDLAKNFDSLAPQEAALAAAAPRTICGMTDAQFYSCVSTSYYTSRGLTEKEILDMHTQSSSTYTLPTNCPKTIARLGECYIENIYTSYDRMYAKTDGARPTTSEIKDSLNKMMAFFAKNSVKNLTAARSQGADAAVKASLNNARAQAELYYDSNSYAGVCTAAMGILNMKKGADAANGAGVVTCNSVSTKWAMSAQLIQDSKKYYCVDGTGASKILTGSIDSKVIECPDK
jgi:hypothetical protein